MILDNYQAILWDNDGTLVDTEKLYLSSTKEIFAKYGWQVDWDSVMHHVLNLGQSPFDFVQDQYKLETDSLAKVRQERNLLFTEKLQTEEISIMPGVKEVLNRYHHKVPMAIVTSSERSALDVILERTGLGHYFDFVITQNDVKKLKPDPESYNLALKKLNLPACKVVAIEDTERGLVAAKKAGLACVVIPSIYVSESDYSSADYLYRTARELLT